MKAKIKVLRRFKDNDKVYLPGEVYLATIEFARRCVSRGDAGWLNGDNEGISGINIKHPEVSIVILVKDALKYVKKCIESINKYTNRFELIIIDNGSNKQTKKYLAGLDYLDFTLITNKENKGVSYGWNQGIKVAKYDYICFINSDCVVTPNWLELMMKGFKYSKDVGIVGPTSCRTKTAQSMQITRGRQAIEDENKINELAKNLKEDYIETPLIGFCFIVKKLVFEKIGVFDYKRYGFAMHEDIDFVWRLRKSGFKSIWCTASYVHHFGAKTSLEMGIDVYKARDKNREILKERRNDPNLYIKNDVTLGKIKRIKGAKPVSSNRKVVVSVNIGEYDNIIEEHFDNPEWEFYIFTDSKINSKLWKPIYVEPKLEIRKESRRYKWLIHRYFPDAEYSLYVDTNTPIKTDLNSLIEKYLTNADIAMRKHPGRNCLYEEALRCSELKLDYPPVIETQIDGYRKEGYPQNYGLHEGGIILRRHTNKINKFNEAVWDKIRNGSCRDQLSTDYVSWKLGIKIENMPSRPDSRYFGYLPHRVKDRQYL
jgi:GT2 family glycosyltransferase